MSKSRIHETKTPCEKTHMAFVIISINQGVP